MGSPLNKKKNLDVKLVVFDLDGTLIDTALYSHGMGRFLLEVTDVQNDSIVRIFGYSSNVQLFYRDTYIPSGGNVTFDVSFRVKDVVPDEFGVFPDYVFSNVRIPVHVTAYGMVDQTTEESAQCETVLKLNPSPKIYLPLLWAVFVLLAFFFAPVMEYKSGWDFAIDVLGLQLIFRAKGFWDISAPFAFIHMSYQTLTNPEVGSSLLALSGLSALFLLQSVYALGFHMAKYPKVSFYTGFEWIIGLPLALYFIWPEHYVTPLFIGLLAGIPVLIVLWKYSELPYSKCHRELSIFKTYSTPVSVAIAVTIALNYTTEVTVPLFAIQLGVLALYWFSSRLAFEKLEWAKKRFDEDVQKLAEGWERKVLKGVSP